MKNPGSAGDFFPIAFFAEEIIFSGCEPGCLKVILLRISRFFTVTTAHAACSICFFYNNSVI
jgi:hypothetical protein